MSPDSKKTQGLQTGDIIRRQYFNGTATIYSLMCVLSYGTERERNATTGLYEDRQYFVGALLEGDVLDSANSGEILDFARITNLFDVDRSGALYLTASDDQAPFLDVVDGIGKNKSLSWPEALESEAFSDSETQYIIKGHKNLNLQYENSDGGNSRIITITRIGAAEYGYEGLKQDFYQFVRVGDQVLISYKVRASKNITVSASLGYIDDLRRDAEWTEDIGTEWEYKFQVVTVEYSGRHLRSFKLDMSGLEVDEEIQIADFNIILLSSVANFGDASATRVGKLDGVTDDVFGQLTGYGAYLQKLYASRSAHISGTLTAGDENGFGATFYAGKIHRNCFLNSLSPNFTHSVHIVKGNSEVVNPTGVGDIYRSSTMLQMEAQTSAWTQENAGSRYCLSFWLYTKQPVRLAIAQNKKTIGEIIVESDQTHEWRRVHKCFDILETGDEETPMYIQLTPTFTQSEYDSVSSNEAEPNAWLLYFTAPQLESGDSVTQYQATDDTLNPTTEYGAWFNRGGIGGTMQNPLLQLNFKDDDGNEGGIGTRSKSFLLRQDGSGYLAKKNIVWDEEGKVSFTDNVTLNWSNFSDDAKDQLSNHSCHILGEDTFVIVGQGESTVITPETIKLKIEEIGFTSTSSQRQWMYLKDNEWLTIEDANALTLEITPDSDMWDAATEESGLVGGKSTLTIRCVVTLSDGRTYTDVKTIRKQQAQGYTLEITSSNGNTFKNGACSTTLSADVYYQGTKIDPSLASEHFGYVWHRYDAKTLDELEIDGAVKGNTLTLNYEISSGEIYICELTTVDVFDYSFPVIF